MNFPELDLDADAPDAFAVLGGVMVLQVGTEMAHAREPSILWGVASVYIFGAAIVLVLAGITDVNVKRWGRPLAGLGFVAVMVGVGMTYLMIFGSTIQTDALAFVEKAGVAILQGQSPYTQTFSISGMFPTPMVGGGHVNQYSYPIGRALVTAPFAAIVPNGARLAVMLATVFAGAVLIGTAPHDLAPLGLAAMLVGDFATWGVNDLTDPLWVAPLLVAIALWPWSAAGRVGPLSRLLGRSSLHWSAVAFGIAMAMKQQAWFCAPFLLLWVIHERDWREGLRYALLVATTFGVLHLPAIVLGGVRSTVVGLLTNLWGPDGTLVHLGVGLSALTLSGAYPLAKWFHTVLLIGLAVILLAMYWQFFERVKWLGWIAWAPLLFVNYRSLANYFVVVAPVAVMILIARRRVPIEEKYAA